MCGICGIALADPRQVADRTMLTRMTAIMRHRGPDSTGFHAAAGIGMGVCRLSIIDTVTGDQPIANEDGTVTVACNGEIYNYVELRDRLQSAGHRFRTGSDAEVIVHLYEENAEEFLQELRGMFGLAVWDARRRRLVLARDRLGIKPLHYAITRQGLVFGSEIKAILAAGIVTPKLDRVALNSLFATGFLPATRTLVAEVRQLPAGHRLIFCNGQAITRAYWEVSFPLQNQYDRRVTDAGWAEALRAKLTEAVRLHLRSDVPVGSWLSGGIDSSAVTALMRRELGQPLDTFTLGFEDRTVDELDRVALLDEYPGYQLIGHRTVCRKHHLELLPRAIWHREQPFGLGVDISRMVLSELTSQHVKVVLTGEGADEVLGGYSWYRANKVLSPFSRLPPTVRQIAAQLLSPLTPWPGVSRVLRAPARMNALRYAALIGQPTWSDPPQTVFSEEVRQALAQTGDDGDEWRLPPAFGEWHPFAQLQYFDITVRLAQSVCHHLDRLSMAYSLEARVPYLDHVFVEFCAAIPPWIKLRRLQEKYVLRRAMRDLLPREILRRRKFPLSAPVRDWMQGDLPGFAAELLSADQLRAKGYFNPAVVAAAMQRHRSGQQDYSRPLLLILGTQLWDEMFRKQLQPPGSNQVKPSGNTECVTT